jgi:indole-3-glycerol phosphate synthase
MNVLEGIIATTRVAVQERSNRVPLTELQRQGDARRAAGDRRSFAAALRAPGLSVIAEHKRSSPSAGLISDPPRELPEVVGAYERAGAAALSILTEGPNFGGSLDDLRAARAAVALPLLRKDFIVERYQVHEADAAGADAILLIVAGLDRPTLAELHALARELELAVLVEVHDERELERALKLEAEVIGVNNRDLTTLRVDTERTYALRASIPEGHVVVAESGFSQPAQLVRLAEAGIDAVLIGEALMRTPDLEAACRALTSAA